MEPHKDIEAMLVSNREEESHSDGRLQEGFV